MTQLLTIILGIFRFIVIPVNFQDRELEADAASIEAHFARVSEYFSAQFRGDREFVFDLSEPVNVQGTMEHYGSNGQREHDIMLYECAAQAVHIASEQIDMSIYDNSGSGQVDAVFLFCPGPSEDVSDIPDSIWPQYSHIGSKMRVPVIHGKRIDAFIAVTEQTGPGTTCHEIGHMFSIPDFYDTDGMASGGICTGLWGCTALMDYGGRNDSGQTPPFMNAIERSIAGIGSCDTLKTGSYRLRPVSQNPYHLLVPAGKKGHDILLECRDNSSWDKFIGGKGLLVFNVDRSADFQTAWEENKVNANPSRPGASIICADRDAREPSQIFFPQPGRHSLSLGNHSINLALRGIETMPDGSVEFKVIEPFRDLEVTAFQDAAILEWRCDGDLDGLPTIIRWKEGDGEESEAMPEVAGSFILDGLKPHRSFRFRIEIADSEGEVYSTGGSFRTKSEYESLSPSIHLSTATRNEDGSFMAGARIPLRINNAGDMESCSWYFDNAPIRCDASGYYTIRRSGRLKAVMQMDDGSVNVIIKQINIR